MYRKVIMGERHIRFWLGVVAVMIMAGTAGSLRAQIPVGRGRGLDANRRLGSGGRNQAGVGGINYQYGNNIVSGNVGGGKSFKGPGAIGSAKGFRGSLGSNSLGNFRRDSYGMSNNAANPVGAPKQFFLPSSTILGVQGITSRRARPGSNMPSNVNLTPRAPRGPVMGPSGKLSKFSGPGPLNRSLDLRSVSSPVSNRPVLGMTRNLFGERRLSSDLGLDRSYEEVIRESLAQKHAVGQEPLAEPAEKGAFQALPPWARPELALPSEKAQSGTGLTQPGVVKSTLSDERIKKNLAKSREVLEESQGVPGLPSIVDIYEQMKAEEQFRPQAETAPSEEDLEPSRPFIPVLGEDSQVSRQKVLKKMLVYNTFVGRRGDSFHTYLAHGESLLKRGRYYQAAKAYQGAIGLKGHNPLGYLGRAYSLAGAGELVSAARSLGEALIIFPAQAKTKIDLKGFFSSQQEIDRITTKLERLVQVKKGDAGIRLLLGYLYHYSGKSAAAVPVLAEAAELAKTDPSISPELAKAIAKFAQDVAK